MSTLNTPLQHSAGSTSHSNQTRRNKRHSNWKRRSKTVLIHRLHDIVHKNPKDSIKKLIDLINEFGNVAGYKINTKRSMAFRYSNSELTETETKKAIPFTTAPKKIKIPWNKLN